MTFRYIPFLRVVFIELFVCLLVTLVVHNDAMLHDGQGKKTRKEMLEDSLKEISEGLLLGISGGFLGRQLKTSGEILSGVILGNSPVFLLKISISLGIPPGVLCGDSFRDSLWRFLQGLPLGSYP